MLIDTPREIIKKIMKIYYKTKKLIFYKNNQAQKASMEEQISRKDISRKLLPFLLLKAEGQMCLLLRTFWALSQTPPSLILEAFVSMGSAMFPFGSNYQCFFSFFLILVRVKEGKGKE